MRQATFRGWTFTFDPEATRRAYESAQPVGPERCGCLYCRNFVAARQHAYPTDVAELFRQVGIQPAAESEVWEYGPLDGHSPHTRLYGGYIHFIGEILSAPHSETTEVQLSSGRDLLPASFGEAPVVQVKFELPVPWVLAEAPTDVPPN